MLLCDGCNLGMHTYCLDPPLTDIPDGQWFCEGCADAIAAARKACPPSRKRPLLTPGERPPKASRGAGGPLCVDLQVVGRCERNPNCVRGYKHGGRGGLCSDRAVLNPRPPGPYPSQVSSAASSSSSAAASSSSSPLSPTKGPPASARGERSPTRPKSAAADLLSVRVITPEARLPAAASAASSSGAAASSSAAGSSADEGGGAGEGGGAAALPCRELTAFRVCRVAPPHLTAALRSGDAGGAGFASEWLQTLQLEGLLVRPAPPSPPSRHALPPSSSTLLLAPSARRAGRACASCSRLRASRCASPAPSPRRAPATRASRARRGRASRRGAACGRARTTCVRASVSTASSSPTPRMSRCGTRRYAAAPPRPLSPPSARLG